MWPKNPHGENDLRAQAGLEMPKGRDFDSSRSLQLTAHLNRKLAGLAWGRCGPRKLTQADLGLFADADAQAAIAKEGLVTETGGGAWSIGPLALSRQAR